MGQSKFPFSFLSVVCLSTCSNLLLHCRRLYVLLQFMQPQKAINHTHPVHITQFLIANSDTVYVILPITTCNITHYLQCCLVESVTCSYLSFPCFCHIRYAWYNLGHSMLRGQSTLQKERICNLPLYHLCWTPHWVFPLHCLQILPNLSHKNFCWIQIQRERIKVDLVIPQIFVLQVTKALEWGCNCYKAPLCMPTEI